MYKRQALRSIHEYEHALTEMGVDMSRRIDAVKAEYTKSCLLYTSFQPLTIMQRMEVEMTNAIPKNSRAKVVERSFKALKDRVMRLFPTFTGGSPAEQPEQLKAIRCV